MKKIISIIRIIFFLTLLSSCGDNKLLPTTNTGNTAPTGVTASAGDGQVIINWNAVIDATSYNIYWSTTSGVTKTTGTKITNATSPYAHTGLTNGTTYYYVVTAVNSNGESSESSQASAIPTATVTPDTTPPTNTTQANFISGGVTTTNSTSVTLSISATDSVGVTGYYASESSTTPSASATGWTAVTSLTSYSATVSFALSSGDGTKTVYVWFKDVAGNVSTSASDTITLNTTAPDTFPPDTSITSQPTNPSNSTSASFSFTSTETGSTFQCQIDSGGYSSCTSPKSYTALTEGSHTFYVKATDSAGNTDSTPASYTWTIDSTAPTVPSELTATAISDTQINLSWTASTDANGVSGYKIYRGGTNIGTSTTTSYSDTGLTGATAYTYTISAYDTAGNESSQSTSDSTTTLGTGVSGTISSDTTWTLANSPYVVTGSVLVNSSVILTIESGVTVKFNSDKSLQATGTLIAKGTSVNKITFTSAKSSPAAGDWGSISFADTSTDATYDSSGNYTSGSILENCTVEYAGGGDVKGAVNIDKAHPFISYCTFRNNKTFGIYADNLSGKLLKITNNSISYNGGSGIYTYSGDFFTTGIISNNIINNNNSNGINSNFFFGAGTISKNIIINNGLSGVYSGLNDNTTITNNVISNNTGSGISSWASNAEISHNTINKNSSASGGVIYSGDSSHSIFKNTIVGNTTTSTFPSMISLYNGSNVINYNNIFDNTASYELYNNSNSIVNTENNWWGTTIDSEIQTKIYDWFDNGSKGVVDYSPFLTSPDTTAPISPPTGLTATAGTGQIALSWTANPESDTAGYKVYWGTTSDFPYANSVDAGNVTSYTIGSLPVGTYYVVVTAYDTTASTVTDDPNTIVNDKQTSGNESWYATEKTVTVY